MKKNLGGGMKKDNEKEKSYSEIMEVYMFKKLEDGNVCEQYIQQRYENELGMWTDIKGAAKATRRHKNTIYNMARNNNLIARKYGNKISILSRSLIFANGDRME